MKRFTSRYRAVSLFSVSVLIAVGLDRHPEEAAARSQEKKTAVAPPTEKKPTGKLDITPPPADINDLSMEVNALRTMYLFRFGPRGDRPGDPGPQYKGLRNVAKDCIPPLRKRVEAKASKNYVKLLTNLRAAFITGHDDRINELSEELKELSKDEQPDLDDDTEIKEQARKNAPRLFGYFQPGGLVSYLSAYGKAFPSPYRLMVKTMRIDGQGKKPSPEEWKLLCDSVIKEVSWQWGGLDLKDQKKVADEARRILTKAYPLSNDELKSSAQGGKLLSELSKLQNSEGGPLVVLKHVVEQDLAEMLSNPRLMPALDAREAYLNLKIQQDNELKK